MKSDTHDAELAGRANFSVDTIVRLAPLIECASEGAGWIHLAEIAFDLLDADLTVAMEFLDNDRTIIRSGVGYDGLQVGLLIPTPPGSHAAYSRDVPGVVITDDLLTERRFEPSPFLLADGIRSSMSLRLTMPSGEIAAVGVHSREVGRFGRADVDEFDALGRVFASAMHRLRRWDELELNARVDSLTGLLNRASILEHLETQFDAHGEPSVMLIDIDGFKAVNDTHGHRVGDTVLRILAERIERCLGPNDRLGRLGGDGFLLVSTDTNDAVDRTLAERVIGHAEEVIMVAARTVQVSASVGIARRRADDDAMSLLERSDRLMYSAKSSGRGEVRTDLAEDPTPLRQRRPATTAKRIATSRLVDEAIEGLRIVVQPIIDPHTGKVHGVEALARGPIDHPLEMPDDLFPAARTFSRLGDLELAAKRLAFELELEPTTMLYVNLEPVLLASRSWMAEFTAAWRDTGAHPNVTVELTERAVLRSPGRLLRAVDLCRSHGWKIALDDVGSRSESLAALRWIDPDVVKLDMSLIAKSDTAHTAHVAASVASHRQLRRGRAVCVIAEGVENVEDARTAEVLGADLLQGYLFGRPMPIDQLRRNDPEVANNRLPPPRRVSGERIATTGQLLSMTRHVESSVTSADTIVLAALQRHEAVTDRTRRQYESLAKRCGFVGIVGVGLNDANVPGIRGVRLAEVDPSDGLSAVWQVITLSPPGSIALLATEIDQHASPFSHGRAFRYRITTDPNEVEQAARRLLHLF